MYVTWPICRILVMGVGTFNKRQCSVTIKYIGIDYKLNRRRIYYMEGPMFKLTRKLAFLLGNKEIGKLSMESNSM